MGNYGGDALTTISVTIADGASLSDAANLQLNSTTYCGMRLCGLVLPSGWDAAAVTFQASADGATYSNLYDEDGEVSVTAITGAAFVALNPAIFAAIPNIKVRSGTSASAVAQSGAVTIGLVLRSV